MTNVMAPGSNILASYSNPNMAMEVSHPWQVTAMLAIIEGKRRRLTKFGGDEDGSCIK